eukprot:GHVP01024959.1.p1 GENE.GHVP01024959.1~~GHVP01024959.1.p1  ORF type:complete len:108 (+),score=10.18 GHVP01024959.1:92-415(+)
MALPPNLSLAELQKFRTRKCERFFRNGICNFADRCQYSHEILGIRRSPVRKNIYFIDDRNKPTINPNFVNQFWNALRAWLYTRLQSVPFGKKAKLAVDTTVHLHMEK